MSFQTLVSFKYYALFDLSRGTLAVFCYTAGNRIAVLKLSVFPSTLRLLAGQLYNL